MKTHMKPDGCGFEGYFSTHSSINANIDCKRCRSKYGLDRVINAYIVKVGKYLNVVDLDGITEDMEILSTLEHARFKPHIN